MPVFSIPRHARLGVIPLVLVVAGTSLPADTLVLLNGNRFEGRYQGQDHGQVQFVVAGHVNRFSAAEVAVVQISPNVPAVSGAGFPVAPRQPLFPSGTLVSIQTIDAIDSAQAAVGQTFRASVALPVWVEGKEVLPAGADCLLGLAREQTAGTFTGHTRLLLRLMSVRMDGRDCAVQSDDIVTQSGSKGMATAGKVGGGAALGALLGGLVGGGRGAAIGAGAGAATGTGVAIVTSGERVRVPAETRLTFTLLSPAS